MRFKPDRSIQLEVEETIRQNMKHVALFVIGLLCILILYISYIQVIIGDKWAFNSLNRRSIIWEQAVQRGRILDSSGKILAYSEFIDADRGYRRIYPYAAEMVHVLGYQHDSLGKTGIEAAYNKYLIGQGGSMYRLGPISHLWEVRKGDDIVLTIDESLQKTARDAMGTARGAVVVLNPKTGAVLAMLSQPDFDPNQLNDQWEELSRSSDSVLLNRAVQGLYPPGSTFKIITAEIALELGKATGESLFQCSGELKIGKDYVLPEVNHKAHGKINLTQALAESCNVTFGVLGMNIGNNEWEKAFERFGFSKTTQELLGEAKPRLPFISKMGDGDLAQLGIGQGEVLVTPLRMAMLASAFANNGKIMQPYVVDRLVSSSGMMRERTVLETWLTPINPAYAEMIAGMMEEVVESGTGRAASIRGVRVAGKTGTAENSHGEPHAWFVGFAPVDDPQIAIAVIVENGGSGGGVAAPIARQIIVRAIQ